LYHRSTPCGIRFERVWLFVRGAAADTLMRMTATRHTLASLALAAGVLAASACASHTPRVRVLPPNTAPVVETKNRGSAIARTAETLLGAPYREGGSLPDGFDCSGLVNYVFARHGIAVPRDVRRQASAGIEVARGEILPGDLVFFATTGSGPTHVGIAVDGGRFIHAPKSGGVVRVESMSAGYWRSRFVTARRVVSGSELEVRQ
jgi:cell wall-associated NlpC family hydrolase